MLGPEDEPGLLTLLKGPGLLGVIWLSSPGGILRLSTLILR